MSIVPNEKFYSADSLTLITFAIAIKVSTADFSIDTYTTRKSFWKSAVLRNKHASDDLSYRLLPDQELSSIPPLSEIPITGWGSFFQVISASGTPKWELDFIAVTLENALRK